MTETGARAPARHGAPPAPAAASARSAWIVGGVLALGWVSLTVWVRSQAPGVPAIDELLHDLALADRTPATIGLATAVSVLGQVDVAVPLAAVGALLVTTSTRRFGRARAASLVALVALAGVAAGLTLNQLVGRARPSPDQWAGAAGGPSFPSGHTTAAALAAMLLAWVLVRRTPDTRLRVVVIALAALWAAGVGWSRVWLGVHWPTDVLCAWLLVPSLLVLGRAAQLSWWPADAPPQPLTEPSTTDVRPEVAR